MIEAYRDLTFFKSNPVNSYYIIDELCPLDRIIFEKTLAKYGKIRKAYQQIRLIDAEGSEQLKINFDKDSIHINRNLEDKSSRYYFKGVQKTQENALYISRFDLSMEGGKVVEPLTPVLRIGTPLFQEGTRQGYLLLNYKGDAIASRRFKFLAESNYGTEPTYTHREK